MVRLYGVFSQGSVGAEMIALSSRVDEIVHGSDILSMHRSEGHDWNLEYQQLYTWYSPVSCWKYVPSIARP